MPKTKSRRASDPLPKPERNETSGGSASQTASAIPTHVRVITEGTLGPDLLKKGDITDDPSYVAILELEGQQKVEAVQFKEEKMNPEETTTETTETTEVEVENQTSGDAGESTTETDVTVTETNTETESQESGGEGEGEPAAQPESEVNVSIDQTINTPGSEPADDPNKNTEAAQEPVDPYQ